MRKVAISIFLISIVAFLGSGFLAYRYVKPRAKEIAKSWSEFRAKVVKAAEPQKPVPVTWEDGVVFESPVPLVEMPVPGTEKFRALCSEEPKGRQGRNASGGVNLISILTRPGLVIDLDQAAAGLMEEFEKADGIEGEATHVKKESRVLNDRAIEVETRVVGKDSGLLHSIVFKRDRRLYLLQLVTLGAAAEDGAQWSRIMESFRVTDVAKKPAITRATGNEGLPPGMKKK